MDDIYYCTEKSTLLTRTVTCIKFDSYESAQKHFMSTRLDNNLLDNTILIPINKYTPTRLIKPVLAYKMSSLKPFAININEEI
jgi:hypothetical protein